MLLHIYEKNEKIQNEKDIKTFFNELEKTNLFNVKENSFRIKLEQKKYSKKNRISLDFNGFNLDLKTISFDKSLNHLDFENGYINLNRIEKTLFIFVYLD